MAAEASEKSFVFEERPDGIGVLTIDRPGQPVNVFSGSVILELNEVVGELEKKELKGLIFCSGKENSFIAGADLNELMTAADRDPNLIKQVIEGGHETFTRVSKLPYPTVAIINGIALGGGLEVTLAMDYRLAVDGPKTEMGLPEVNIGIVPGWGGTQRLPRLIGVGNALELASSGKTVKPPEAFKLGLVFDVVAADKAMDEAVYVIEMAHRTGDWLKHREMMQAPMELSEDQHLFAIEGTKGFIMGKTKGHYPAPIECVKVIGDGINRPLEEGLALERKTILSLVGTDISRNLIGLFFMDQTIRKDPGVEDKSIKPAQIKKAGVVGAGVMGAGIATAFIRRGISTPLLDIKQEFLEKGIETVNKSLGARVKIGRMTEQEVMRALSFLTPTLDHNVLCSGTDIVVEAVVERLDIKQKVFTKLEEMLSEEAIIASNTSTISITEMAECLKKRDRFVGMHFFNPVDRMQLVEVIRGKETSDQTVATTVALAKLINKKPIVVNDCPGFLVNRVLMPYLSESVLMVQEGADVKFLDKVATKFGMPMGPITLSDLIGIDVMVHAGKVLADAYPGRSAAPMLLKALFDAGRLGQKTGSGFMTYTFRKGKAKGKPDEALIPLIEQCGTEKREHTPEEMTDRMFLPMLNEASRLLPEGIVRKPSDVDMGLILGTGFPPFKGGLLRWADSMGAAEVVSRLENLRPLGERFEPSPILKEMAASGKKFYND